VNQRKKSGSRVAQLGALLRKAIDFVGEETVWYRYQPIEVVRLDSLEQSQLYFSRRDALNDPADCRIDIRADLNRAAGRSAGRTQAFLRHCESQSDFWEAVDGLYGRVGVCCFTADPCNQHMWREYAADGAGICVGYVLPKSLIDSTKTGVIGFSDVEYDEGALERFFCSQCLCDGFDQEQFVVDTIKKAMTTKVATWKEEREWRLIRREGGPLPIPQDCLKSVIFGPKVPDDMRAQVVNKARKANPNVALYQAQYCESGVCLIRLDLGDGGAA
jgi:hypothetical protein